MGQARAVGMIEEHGGGKQLFRLRAWPQIPGPAIGLVLFFGLLSALGAYDQAWFAALALGVGAIGIAVVAVADCANAMRVWNEAIAEYTSAENELADLRTVPGSPRAHSSEMTS